MSYVKHQIVKRGFTMIELLMVMAILGVLASLVVVTFPAATGRARDSNRQSDLKQYQIALETYANRNNGVYPSQDDVKPSTICATLGASSCTSDPKDGSDSCNGSDTCQYLYRSDGTDYILYSVLERPSNSSKPYWVVCSNGLSGSDDAVKLLIESDPYDCPLSYSGGGVCVAPLVMCGALCIDPDTNSTYCGANASCSTYVTCLVTQTCNVGTCI